MLEKSLQLTVKLPIVYAVSKLNVMTATELNSRSYVEASLEVPLTLLTCNYSKGKVTHWSA